MHAVPPPSSAGSSTERVILCREVTKRFGTVTALDRLNLEVPRGVLLGLLGPNGAGKTTLIRILLGLTTLTDGHATVLGAKVPSKSVLPRIGYMPQNLAVYSDLTVEENIELFGRLFGIVGDRLRRRTSEILDLVRLADRRHSLLMELSGGMQRRVSFAAALVSDPDLLLLDEPTVGVDPELRSDFWRYFHRLTEAGRTVVLTTHYLEEANRADRVVFLHAGSVLAMGSPAEIKARTGTSNLEDAFLEMVRERRREGRSPAVWVSSA